MRVHGVGTDIVDVARVERLLAGGGSFLRWFSDDEAARCRAAEHPAPAFAAVLAAKEAAWKSLGLSWDAGVPWRSVLVTEDGAVRFVGDVAGAAREAGVGTTLVTSVSDTPRWGSSVPHPGVSCTTVTDVVMAHAISYR